LTLRYYIIVLHAKKVYKLILKKKGGDMNAEKD
jgi:hypothetical protein